MRDWGFDQQQQGTNQGHRHFFKPEEDQRIDSHCCSGLGITFEIVTRTLVESFQRNITTNVSFLGLLKHEERSLDNCLCFLELFHALSHTQVLFGLGPLYSKDDLRSRQWYFISDAVTAFVSCCLLVKSRKYRSLEPILAMTAVLHFVLHAFYVINWYNQKSFAVQSILDWSSEADLRRRVDQHGMTMFLFNFTGTLFDVCVHYFLTSMLFHHASS